MGRVRDDSNNNIVFIETFNIPNVTTSIVQLLRPRLLQCISRESCAQGKPAVGTIHLYTCRNTGRLPRLGESKCHSQYEHVPGHRAGEFPNGSGHGQTNQFTKTSSNP